MKYFQHSSLIVFFLFVFIYQTRAQQNTIQYFSFKITNKSEINAISKIISIDKVKGDQVWAYANEKEMEAFKLLAIDYEIVPEPKSDPKSIVMATTISQMANWDRYPTYDVYVQMMNKFATDYPTICKLEEIGTLASGRKLLALKISDNVLSDTEAEPELLYTSTIHGDEATGFIMLLRLADYLLSNYGKSSFEDITNLVNSSEIWLNPDANPDGTYHGGNSTISGSQRYNANSVDLNRNYPDPAAGDHPDGNSWQPETVKFKAFATNHHFALSANFHGGTEVFNYPWDTWSRITADDAWWQYVGHNFADEAQSDAGNNGYMSDFDDGITNGYAWYTITGGRQDYMNYWHYCREVTIEISNTKLISSDLLPAHWTYLRDALLNYLGEGLCGVQGTVKGSCDCPIAAKVEVLNHDKDNSWVTTDSRAGDYYRYLKAGTYSLKFTADGYLDKVVNNVSVIDGQATVLNIVMTSPEPDLRVSPTQITKTLAPNESANETLTLSNVGGANLNYTIAIENAITNTWISLSRADGTITPGNSHSVDVILNTTGLSNGEYHCNILINGDKTASVPVTLTIDSSPLMVLNKTSFSKNLLTNEFTHDSLLVTNSGNANLYYNIAVKNPISNPWLTLNTSGGTIFPGSTDTVLLAYNPAMAGVGSYNTALLIGGDFTYNLPVALNVDTIPLIKLGSDSLAFTKITGQSEAYSLSIKNAGGGILNYQAEVIDANQHSWLTIQNPSGSLLKGTTGNINLSVNATGLVKDVYTAMLRVKSPDDTVIIDVVLTVDNLPEFYIPDALMDKELYAGSLAKDTISIINTGGSVLSYVATIEFTDSSGWLVLQSPEGTLTSQQNINFIATFDARKVDPGVYRANIHFTGSVDYREPVEMTVIAKPELAVNVFSFSQTLVQGADSSELLILSNVGGGILNYSIIYGTNEGYSWASINKMNGAITAGSSDTLIVSFKTEGLEAGEYSGSLGIITTSQKNIPLSLTVVKAPQLTIGQTELNFNLETEKEQIGIIDISNTGGLPLSYSINWVDVVPEWLTLLTPAEGSLIAGESDQVKIKVSTMGLAVGEYNSTLTITADTQSAQVAIRVVVYTGIEGKKAVKVQVVPNPFTGQVTLICSSSSRNNAELIVYNAIGLEVYRSGPVTSNNNAYKFEWNGFNNQGVPLPVGAYLYRIVTNNESVTGKIMKQ